MCDTEGGGNVMNAGDFGRLDTEEIPENVREYFKLPQNIQRRVKALKKLQYKTLELDAEFYRRLYALEKEFEGKHQELYNKRSEIVKGSKEPSDDECDFEDTSMQEWAKLVEEVDKMSIQEVPSTPATGVPDFWLKAMRHDMDLSMMIMEHDVPVLKHLTEVTCTLAPESQPGFTLDFYFSSNEWFANEKLSKTYFFSYDIPKDDPFEYSGPEIVACQGCHIDWNIGKDLTVKKEKKVQKHKNRPNEKRTIEREVKNDSFFNFFNAEKLSLEDDEIESDFLELDFKIGQFIRETLIPRAVLFFTGEAPEEDPDDLESMDDDDDDDMDDDDESDEEDDEPHLAGKASRRHRHGKGRANNNNEDCKQQ